MRKAGSIGSLKKGKLEDPHTIYILKRNADPMYFFTLSINVIIIVAIRPVVPGGAGDAMAPPDFGRLVNPISTKGGRLCPPNNTGTPEFSDPPTAL